MVPKIENYGIHIKNDLLVGEQYAMRLWYFIGATSGLILTAATFVGPVIFLYFMILSVTSPQDVVLKTSEGDVTVGSFYLNLFTSTQKANGLKQALDAALFNSGPPPIPRRHQSS